MFIKLQNAPVYVYSRDRGAYWRGGPDGSFGGYVERDHAASWSLAVAYLLVAASEDKSLELHFMPTSQHQLVLDPRGDSPWMAALRSQMAEIERLRALLLARSESSLAERIAAVHGAIAGGPCAEAHVTPLLECGR